MPLVLLCLRAFFLSPSSLRPGSRVVPSKSSRCDRCPEEERTGSPAGPALAESSLGWPRLASPLLAAQWETSSLAQVALWFRSAGEHPREAASSQSAVFERGGPTLKASAGGQGGISAQPCLPVDRPPPRALGVFRDADSLAGGCVSLGSGSSPEPARRQLSLQLLPVMQDPPTPCGRGARARGPGGLHATGSTLLGAVLASFGPPGE